MKCRYGLIFLFFSGCMVGPNYKQPKASYPKTFQEAKNTNEDQIGKWWKQFNDPTLDRLITFGLKQNYDYKIAKERIAQYRAQYRVARADLFPQIDGTAKAVRSKISETLVNSQFLGARYQDFFEIGFDAIWELDFFGRIRRETQAALYAVEAQIYEKEDIQITLLSEIARVYVDIRYLQAALSIAKQQQQVERKIYDLYQDRFISGIDSLISPEVAYANLQNLSAEIPLLHQALKQNFYALVALLGKNPDQMSLSRLKKAPIPIAKGVIKGTLPSCLLRRRPDIKRSERLLAQSTAIIGVATADLFPTFSLVGTATQQSQAVDTLLKSDSSSWNVGPIMNWPLITFGKVRSNIDEKKSLQKQAFLSYQKTVIDAFKDVESALVAYFDEQKHLQNLTEALDANIVSLHLSSDLAQTGIESDIDYLNVQRQALEQERFTIESQRTVSTNLIAVYKALGGGF